VSRWDIASEIARRLVIPTGRPTDNGFEGENALTHSDYTANVSAIIHKYSSPSLSMAHLLFANRDPASVAYTLIGSDLTARHITWDDLQRESAVLAQGFRQLGVRPGDRIATLMHKSRDYLTTLMAIWRLGAVHVPIFTAFAAEPIEFRLRSSACKLVICDQTQESKLVRSDTAAPDNIAIIVTSGPSGRGLLSLEEARQEGQSNPSSPDHFGNGPIIEIYTSGTTGQPKGVTVSIQALAAFRFYLEAGLNIARNDVFWNAADPGWAYGLYYGVLAPCLTETTALMFEGGFSPEVYVRILRDYRVTNFAAAPTVYRAIEAAGLPAPGPLALKRASSAGEPLTLEINRWACRYLGVAVHDHYGQTETGMVVNNHHHPSLAKPLKPGSMGQAMTGWRVAILKDGSDEPASSGEIGRVAVDVRESPLAWFKGYVDDPVKSAEKFSADGRWYLTGDVGRRDDEGYFFFSSRDDDVIIMSGYRIGPLELESVLLMHGAVAECAVVAVPHRISGETVEAVVVLKAGHEPSEALTAELQQAVKQGFAAHAYPRRVHYVSALPKTASGKVQRSRVRQELAQ
jgi:acetyl-CoA synthetase